MYDGVPGTHLWYDGTPHPWEFKRIWHLEPSLTEADTVFAGAEDAAMFKSTDGGTTWNELSGLLGRSRIGQLLATRRGRDVPAHDRPRSEELTADVYCNLRGRAGSHRRWRSNLASC